jgi:hypothetical protein
VPVWVPFLILGNMDEKNLLDYPLAALAFMLVTWMGQVTVSDIQAVSTIFAQLIVALAAAFRLYNDVNIRKKKE